MNTKAILKQLFESYPKNGATEGTVAQYFRLLQNIPPDDLQAIVDQCVVECKFLPTIAEIVERHRNITGALAPETAAEQWGQVTRAMREVGYVQTPRFRDPVTAKIISQWGWENLCASDTPMADRAHFLKMYQSIADRQERIDRLTPAARQIAEQRGGLTPIGQVMRLTAGNRDN